MRVIRQVIYRGRRHDILGSSVVIETSNITHNSSNRRISRTISNGHVSDIETEMGDRFGSLPAEVRRLLDLARLRIAASSLSIDSISKQPGMIVIGHHDIRRIEKWRQACLLVGQEVRIVENKTVVLPLHERDASDGDRLFQTVKNISKK